MVSYGETYGKQQSGLGESSICSPTPRGLIDFDKDSSHAVLPLVFSGLAALSLLTSGKYVIDPELRGAEFERITQNLDLQFWKSFWNLTESEFLTVGRVKCS